MAETSMKDPLNEGEGRAILDEIETLITRMQKIQREIRSTGEPASRFEIEQLKELGQRYAILIGQLENGRRPPK